MPCHKHTVMASLECWLSWSIGTSVRPGPRRLLEINPRRKLRDHRQMKSTSISRCPFSIITTSIFDLNHYNHSASIFFYLTKRLKWLIVVQKSVGSLVCRSSLPRPMRPIFSSDTDERSTHFRTHACISIA
jgi:hypothetical protein